MAAYRKASSFSLASFTAGIIRRVPNRVLGHGHNWRLVTGKQLILRLDIRGTSNVFIVLRLGGRGIVILGSTGNMWLHEEMIGDGCVS